MTTAPTTTAARALALLRQGGLMVLDLIYPPRCPGCGRVGDLFCPTCRAQVMLIAPPVCPRCSRPTAHNELCAACRDMTSSLDRIISATLFAGPLRKAIHSLKYANVRDLARPLGAYLIDAWRQAGPVADRIVPVPLHARRQAERGYNQSALLAHILGQAIGVPVDEKIVVRHKATQQQALLNAVQRRENVKDAFTCQGTVAGLRIVLVDDVCTTGATLEACAAALKAGGAASVWALTLARARWEPGQPAPDAAQGGVS